MRVVTADARFRPRPNALMGFDKGRGVLFVALGAQLTFRFGGQGGMIRTVRIMTDGAVLGRRLVQGTVPPILGHFAMTAQAKGRHAFAEEAGMG